MRQAPLLLLLASLPLPSLLQPSQQARQARSRFPLLALPLSQ